MVAPPVPAEGPALEPPCVPSLGGTHSPENSPACRPYRCMLGQASSGKLQKPVGSQRPDTPPSTQSPSLVHTNALAP